MPKRTGPRPELAPFVYDFARRLHEEVGAQKVILFGSRARGDWLQESDYDFVVVAERFEGVHFVKRPVELYQYWEGQPGCPRRPRPARREGAPAQPHRRRRHLLHR